MIPEPIQIITNTNSVFRLFKPNILHIIYADNVVLEIEDVIEVQLAYRSLPDPKPLSVLSELGKHGSFSTEARTYAAQIAPDLDKSAYIIKGLAQRLIVRFYLKVLTSKGDNKVFDCFEEAYNWVIKDEV